MRRARCRDWAPPFSFPNSLALLNHAYPDQRGRGRAVGIWAAGASLALTAGPLAGGALIALIGWRSIFLVNLPIGIAGLWLSWRYATETTRNRNVRSICRARFWRSQRSAVSPATIIEGGALGMCNAFVIAGFAGSALLAVLFIMQEARSSHPMLPLSLFAHRLFALTSLVGLLVNIAFYGLIFVFSLYFQRVNGLSPLQTGLAFVPMMGMVLPANLSPPASPSASARPRPLRSGGALAALGCLMLLAIEPGTSYFKTLAQLMIIGGGLGLLVPPLTATLLGSVEKSRSGIAAGVLNATRQTGSVLGVALVRLAGRPAGYVHARRASSRLLISAALLLIASAVIWRGAGKRKLTSALAECEMGAAKRHHRAKAKRRKSGHDTGDRRNRAWSGGGLACAREHQHADRDQELPHPLRNLPRRGAVHQRRGEIPAAKADGCDQPPRQRGTCRHEFAGIGSPQAAEIEPKPCPQHMDGEREQHAGNRSGGDDQAAWKWGRLRHGAVVE